MKFGKRFERELIPEWRQHYLQYNQFKRDIKSLGTQEVDTRHFNMAVEEQVTHVIDFYDELRARLEEELFVANRTKALYDQQKGNVDLLNLEALLLEYQRIGEDIVAIFQFLQLNSIGLRKILKKFDKHVNAKGPKFLVVVQENDDSELAESLKCLKDYSVLKPLVESVCDTISSMQQYLKGKIPSSYLNNGWAILQDLRCIKQEMQSNNAYLAFLSSTSNIAFPKKVLRTPSMVRAASQQEIAVRFPEEIRPNRMSEWINLGNTFFYMMNYYIVVPTAGEYAAALGLDPSASGVLIAMQPIAALISAILYSQWSNYSFKKPLVAGSFLLVIGNLMYGLAWDVEMTWFILVGRFVCGLGGCRTVNRRYIADTISVEHRTRASVAFVAVGALGMAAGPFSAFAFEDMNRSLFGFVTINEMTAPALFMAIVWVVFIVLTMTCFEEPNRIGASVAPGEEYDDDFLNTGGGEDEDADGLSDLDPYVTTGDEQDEDDESFFDAESEDGRGRFDRDDDDDDEQFDDSIDIVLDNRDYGTIKNNGNNNSNSKNNTPSSMVNEFALTPDEEEVLLKKQLNGGSEEMLNLSTMTRETTRMRREKWRTWLTILCLWLIFWVKLLQEGLLTVMPVVTPTFYGWASGKVGMVMASLGLIVVPCNMLLVQVSRRFGVKDTFWLRVLHIPIIIASVILVSFQEDQPLSLPRFMIGNVIMFCSAQVIEGVIMSYFSKIISRKLAAGTWNSGLLVTEAGTLGRAVGNALITILGHDTKYGLYRNLYLLEGSVTTVTFTLLVAMFATISI